jgi:DNA-binding NarL/FixJ family response regulator
MPPSIVRISIVEDDRATREGFLKLLRRAPNIVCVGAYESAEKAEKEIPQNLPDLALVDINLPGRNGIECVAKLKRAHPHLEFLMITNYDDSALIFDALRAGASGYLLKRAVPDELLGAIEEVLNGGSPMSMQIARKVVFHFHQIREPVSDVERLTKREHDIVSLLAKGLAYKQIAEQLGVSFGTVQTHLHNIYKKMHVQSGTEAVVKFLSR